MQKLNIALIGLGFGGSFAEIYKAHPNVGDLAVFDVNKTLEREVREKLGIEKEYNSLDEILADESIDAVHLVTPIPQHEEQTVKVLNAGKHCACTVPMATSIEGLKKIIEAKRRSGKKYMMMETTLYTYQFLYAKKLYEEGKLGKIQFLRGSHYQDMMNWPDYWMGLPPMYYGTHAISPMRVLADSRIKRVVCFGSGTMEDWLSEQYNNPFPVESALFEFENGMKGEATRSLFETSRAYQEGMFVYGSEASFEWGFRDADAPYITTKKPKEGPGARGCTYDVEVVDLPNLCETLPEEIREFTVEGDFDPLNPQQMTKGAASGHHGSHPHLVHEFISSILEDRKPAIDEILGANITGAGICAHESAMNNGKEVYVPEF